jgi:pyruvate carboxylase
VRTQYRAFESDLKGGASEVYLHEMPGGQFTNLKEQARSLGLESRWHEVAQTYADVNQMFGDIVKVTPSSKVVGDMALAMVSAGLTRAEVEDPNRDIAFPDSVVGFFAGDLGQPPGGFPPALQKKVLKGKQPMTQRPGSYLKDVDLEAERKKVADETGMEIDDLRLASYLMYPKVFTDFARSQDHYGPTEVLPTPVYFYGLAEGEELLVDIEKGKTLVLQYLGRAETNEKGEVRVFFDLNGQPRTITVPDRLKAGEVKVRAKAAAGDPKQVGAPMPGVISTLAVQQGQKVTAGDVLCSIEAMKMETAIHAETDGTVAEVLVKPGDQIDAKDLLVRLE